MTPEMATKLTGMESMELLEDLNRRNCFLEKRQLSEASYQYHPLFREFLLSRSIRHFTPESLRKLKTRAAEILTDKSFVEEAIDLYSEAKEYKPLIKLLLAQAPVLISQGRHQRLTTWIDLLPAELAEKNPWLLFWHGLGLLPSHPREGQERCIRAYELFTQSEDLPGRIFSWSTIIETFLILRAVITPVDYWINEGEKLETLISDKLDINLVSRFTSSMFAALVLRNPGHPKILQWQSQCEKFLQQCTDEQILAVLSTNLTISYFWFGQIHKSRLMLASLQPPDPTRISPVILLGYHTIKCLLLLSQGNWTQCQKTVEETIAIAKESGIHIHDSILLTNGAYSGLLVGDLNTANRFLQKVKKSLLPQALFDIGQYHFARAWYKAEKGLLVEAAIECEISHSLAQKSGHPFAIGCTTLLLAQLYLENGEVEQAVKELEHLRDNPRLLNCNQIHFSMHLILADCAFSQNRRKAGYSHLKTAFSQISEDGVSVPLGLVRERLAFLCAKALSAEIEPETVKAFVKLVKLPSPSKTVVGEEWPWPVRIYVLGQLEVYHFDEKLTLSKKTPTKVLELLKLLIATGKIKQSRESVADRLWPDSDGDKAMQNLSTTTHRLRKLLRFKDSVISEEGKLFLNSRICWIDSYYFADLLKQITQVKQLEQKPEKIRQILSVYRGGFDLGQNYNSVIIGYSEQLRKQWENIAVQASRELVLTNNSQEAIDILNDFMNYGGNIHRIYKMLVNFFYDSGRLNEALMIYEQYEAVIIKSGEVPDDELKAICKIMLKN